MEVLILLFLKNISQNRIWGSNRLKDYGADTPETGSVYSVSATKEINCGYVDYQDNKSGKLFELAKDNPEQLGLLQGETYPLIVDMLGADKNLSIQVHPQDDFAKKLGYQYGKTESWFFIEAPTSGSVYGGIKQDEVKALTPKELSKNPLKYVDTVNAKIGDYLYVPNGTVHAIRSGSLVYEIQQSTDITYRIYDYKRKGLDGQPRKLNTKEAIDNLDPLSHVEKRNFETSRHVDEKAYALDLIDMSQETEISNNNDVAAVFTLIAGSIEIDKHGISQGSSLMLMPHETVNCVGTGRGILATPKTYWRA